MKKLWQDEAWEEYLYWQTHDKKTLKKINKLLTGIDWNGYQCIGKPEPLSGNLAGYWSVWIDAKNRIVFRIDEDNLEIIQCGTKYRDKQKYSDKNNMELEKEDDWMQHLPFLIPQERTCCINA